MRRNKTASYIEEPAPKASKPTKKVSDREAFTIDAEPKQPKAIKLSTIWKVFIYTFAIIGVVLTAVYINDTFNGIVEARANELLKAASVQK